MIGTENPVTERSEIMSEESRGHPWRGSAATENTNNNADDEELRSELLQDVLEWLQECSLNLVDESVPAEPLRHPLPRHRDTSSSSHELPMEPGVKVEPGSGKHSVSTHFPKDPNCDTCLRTKIARASCRRRTGTVVPRAETFGDLMTEDHKFLSEGCESRHNHRYVVVVQDLATQRIQSYPRKTKTFLGNTKERAEVLGAGQETKSHSH